MSNQCQWISNFYSAGLGSNKWSIPPHKVGIEFSWVRLESWTYSSQIYWSLGLSSLSVKGDMLRVWQEFNCTFLTLVKELFSVELLKGFIRSQTLKKLLISFKLSSPRARFETVDWLINYFGPRSTALKNPTDIFQVERLVHTWG